MMGHDLKFIDSVPIVGMCMPTTMLFVWIHPNVAAKEYKTSINCLAI
jgi:hypothetical protein